MSLSVCAGIKTHKEIPPVAAGFLWNECSARLANKLARQFARRHGFHLAVIVSGKITEKTPGISFTSHTKHPINAGCKHGYIKDPQANI